MPAMGDIDSLLLDYADRLQRALRHLRYSYKKVRRLPVDSAKLDDEQLETWESFSARFARVVDLFLTKYIRSAVLRSDPGFEGSLRDFVNHAEKLGLVESADRWMVIRELRNITAHEYTDEELTGFFRKCRGLAEEVLRIERVLGKPRKRRR